MKIIAAFFIMLLLLITALTSSANTTQYSLTFYRDQSGQLILLDDERDWKFIGSAVSWDLYIDKYMVEQIKDEYVLHGVTVYKDGQEEKFDGLPFLVKKIYTHGYLVCKERILYVADQWYVTSKGVVVYSQSYKFGEFISDMNDPNTTRNKVFKLLCGDRI